MEDIIQGKEFANQLQILLENQNPFGDGILASSAKDLTNKILLCFTNAISKMNSGETDEVCQSPALTGVDSPCSDDRKTEDSGVSRKILTPKKIGSKRRKSSHSWIRLTPTPIDDGRAWRKYGQKEILNSKFPRSYFRCTHKTDQGCQATKQIQKTEDDPPMYRTTYIGQHTCKDTLKAPQLILDSSPTDTCVLNFQSNYTPKQDFPFPLMKQEIKGELANNDKDSAQSSDFLVWPDLPAFDSSGPTSMWASTSGSDHGDVNSGVYSCTTSDESFDMGIIVGDVNFDEVYF
ncbi:DNA-binding WRKY [Macleaya cordata]|uniref:DNA-binding WRKY n=1 Tax=Macleaya cordata TaxID=56857 RepID=A0A200QTD1_MACCD|nr:DNA-binding WRKY [Macleaya cordata]